MAYLSSGKNVRSRRSSVALLTSPAFNSLSDLILTAIPAVVLLKLQMQKRIKMALVALFATSLLYAAESPVQNERGHTN